MKERKKSNKRCDGRKRYNPKKEIESSREYGIMNVDIIETEPLEL